MFGFMKKHSEKDREEKERKRREKELKKELKIQNKLQHKADKRPLTQEELQRLEEAKKGLFRRTSDTSRRSDRDSGGYAYPYPGGPSEEDSSEGSSAGSMGKSSPRDENEPVVTKYTTYTQFEMSKPSKRGPQTMPKPKRGILKGKSSYGPEIPNQGVTGNAEDTDTVEANTWANEVLSGKVGIKASQSKESVEEEPLQNVKVAVENLERIASPSQPVAGNKPTPAPRGAPKINMPPPPTSAPPLPREPPPPLSPSEKTFGDRDLQLPSVAPPRCPKPREITLRRQPAGDFGFTLRRGTVLERGLGENTEKKRMVIFAEPGPKNTQTGLLPGDRLVEVNNSNVENSSREDIIEMIKKSGDSVTLRVQPIPELSELSMRAGLDGEDVHIMEQSVKSGTLQRSGSMRFKSRMAKSDEQVASERAWLSAEKVWLVHRGGFTGARVLKGIDDLAEGKCKVKLDFNGEELEVDEDDVEKANPPQFDRIEDLATLRYLNESSMLHTLRQRYGSNLLHAYAGQSLLIVNPMHPMSIYSEKVMQMFKGCRQEDMPPHIYATAQIAYRSLLASRVDQSIVLMGRSGSGKSTNLKHVMHYLTLTAGSVNGILTVEKLNGIFTLLDAFGNSRTIMNTSATRFSSLTSLDFDHAGQISSASVQVLLFEKARVVRRPEGEPTFHVFYQMLAGIDSQLRNELQLQNLSEPNIFMTPLQRAEDRQRANQAWSKIHSSMVVLGVTEAECKALYCVLAAIYHLGVAGSTKGANNKYQFARPAAAQRAAAVLGTTVEELTRNIFSAGAGQASGRGGYRSPSHGDKSSASETLTGAEALEGFVIGLYSEVFSALVSLINRSLSSNYRTLASILIVDMPGFQNPASCGRPVGSSFDDLCHNYAQERLQLLFHDTVFTSQQDLYSQENIECDFDMITTSPAALVNLIDKPPEQNVMRSPSHDLQDTDQRGLLWLLDEEALFPGSTEESFMERILLHHGTQSDRLKAKAKGRRLWKQPKGESLMQRGNAPNTFLLSHFQGTNGVLYNTKGWLKAARENPVSRTVNVFLQDSYKNEISSLFTTIRGSIVGVVSGSVVGLEGSSSLRRVSSLRRSGFTSGSASLKRKSVCLQVKFQVDSLIDTIRRTRMHFIHCVLPQNNAGLCDLRAALMPNKPNAQEDIMLNVPLVRSQIRGAEVVDSVRIHRQGFPEHILFSEFRHRFGFLAPSDAKPQSPVVDEKQAVEQLLQHLEIDKSSYRLGLSQVFFRAGALSQLEDARDDKIGGTIVALQAHCRGHLGRQKLKKLKLQHMAVTCIQRNVKKFMAIREWPWWRLYTKVKPLLDVHRTEEELKSKDIEIEQLKARFEKLEKERNELKHTVDKLESKLSEMTADFQEEHTTSSHATELLESETTQRFKLEKDLKDLQTKFNNLQRKHETTELDLMQTRLLVASLDEELDEEDEDGDSVYRQKYERSKREVEFVKKKLGQVHEEEVELHATVKKQLERKLFEANQETEELRKQVQNLKRKSQRINADMQDMKLHLEEQVSRNSDLEKKQRKFDNELRKVTEQLKDEKMQREKLQRERDGLAAEKYTVEQELKNLKLDKELENDKITRLESELLEVSSTGTKDDKEAVHLKRIKADLENKLAEQEEELDDQAGTIQQLEQAKLRLEMSQEKLRQQHLKEIEDKEQEMEDMRAATQKKVRGLESQLEEEYEEKQKSLKDKRELERKLQELGEQKMTPDRDTEKRLRRDLKKTRALLQDAQLMLEKQKEAAGSRGALRQLRNQLEDAEYATAAAVKARKGVEMEVADLQQQLDDMSKSKQNLDDRLMTVSREKNDLQSRLEEHDEDYEELMKKYKAAVAQISTDRITIEAQSRQIEDLSLEKEKLNEEVASLQSNLEYLQSSTVDKQVAVRFEAKVRELESRVELEQTAKSRAETQLGRVKEQVETISEEKEKIYESEQRHLEETKRSTRQLRDVREELAEVQRKEAESSQRKHDLELKVESLESDYEQSQADLRLAFKRISDLQAVIEDDLDSDDDSDMLDSDDNYDSETNSEDEDEESFLVNHASGLSSRMSLGSNVKTSYNSDNTLADILNGSATDDSSRTSRGWRQVVVDCAPCSVSTGSDLSMTARHHQELGGTPLSHGKRLVPVTKLYSEGEFV